MNQHPYIITLQNEVINVLKLSRFDNLDNFRQWPSYEIKVTPKANEFPSALASVSLQENIFQEDLIFGTFLLPMTTAFKRSGKCCGKPI